MPFRRITGKRVLVTGGAGFIGSNLVRDLLAHDNEVVVLDSFLTGKRANIEEFTKAKNFHLIEGDIRDQRNCQRAVDGADYVLHQAALGSVPRSIDDPHTTNDINVNGFLNVLVAARDARVKRFVYATSSSVYGNEKRLPKVESKTGKPLSPYAVSKAVNEQYARVFADLYGMEIIGLRYFNVFGEAQDPEGAYAAAIPKFIHSLIELKSPLIHGDGTQSRDFTYVQNVVQANHIAATTTNPAAIAEVFNVASGVSTNLNELLDALKSVLKKYNPAIAKVEPVYGEERIGDVRHSLASIVKATTLLGYRPETDLEAGLEKAVTWYLDRPR